MIATLVILAVSVVLFIHGKIRSDIVALLALISLIVSGILTPQEALSGFSDPVLIMMIGLFVIGGAIFQTGLAKMVSRKILQLAGTSQTKLFILVMLATASIGAFVSNTGTVALMLPIVISLSSSANTDPRRLLMPLAFASSLGGMLTLIGTPPNLVINGELIKAGYKGLSFFSLFPIGIVCVTVGILLLFPLTKFFLSKNNDNKEGSNKKSLEKLAQKYQLAQNLFRIKISPDSLLINQRLKDLSIPQKYNVDILEIRRKSTTQNPFFKTITHAVAAPETIPIGGDILYVLGSFENVLTFSNENKLELLGISERETSTSKKFSFEKIGIAEVVLMSNSKLVGQPIKNSGLREKFRVNVLGIQRKDEYILHGLKDEVMQAGDALLIQGDWKDITLLSEEQEEWVVVGQPQAEALKVTTDYKAPIAALIMVLMVVCMAFDNIPIAPVTAVIIAAVLMVLTGCLRTVEDAYKTINWESIVLIGAMLPMSLAIEKTGLSTIISTALAENLGKEYGPIALLAGIYFATSLLTMFISNTATAVLFAPIAILCAKGIGANPLPFLFAVAIAASMCFASPFSTPPNALVMSAGRYTFMDYIKVGLPLQIIMGIVMIIYLPMLFPFFS